MTLFGENFEPEPTLTSRRLPPHPSGTFLAVCLLLATVSLSCREGPSPEATTPGATGSIEGAVRLLGTELALPTPVENTTDPEICGKAQTLDDLLVSPQDRGVRYAIAALLAPPVEAVPAVEPGRLVLDNADCRFSPHASVTSVGSTVEVVNRDALLHTTHFYGPAEMSVSLAMEGVRRTVRLDRPGIYVVKCDIHGWMQAFIRVDPHPYHAVTDENGGFRIDEVPVGSHKLEIWHEKLGPREVDIQVKEGETVPVLIEYSYDGS